MRARATCEEGPTAIGYTITVTGAYVDRITVQCNRPTYRVKPVGTDPGSGAAETNGGKGGQRSTTGVLRGRPVPTHDLCNGWFLPIRHLRGAGDRLVRRHVQGRREDGDVT